MSNSFKSAPEISIDQLIEALIGKQLRGSLTDADFVRLQELIAQRSRAMRPASSRSRMHAHAA